MHTALLLAWRAILRWLLVSYMPLAFGAALLRAEQRPQTATHDAGDCPAPRTRLYAIAAAAS